MRQGRIGDRLLHRHHPPREERRRERDAEIVGLRAASTQTIYPHIFDNADREVGGVLVGRMPADGGLPLITAAIPAISADEQRATLTFTQEAWAHVHQVLDSELPPDEQIVGWYHSHPGFGIFLSGHDLFIHENFFSAPSQIAVVVDPLACTEGAFAWRQGELRALFEHPTPPPWKAPAGLAEMRMQRSRLDEPEARDAQAGRGPFAGMARKTWLPPALLLAVVLCVLVFLLLVLAEPWRSGGRTHGAGGHGSQTHGTLTGTHRRSASGARSPSGRRGARQTPPGSGNEQEETR